MKEPLEDKTVLITIAATLLIVFFLIFSTRPIQKQLQPSLQWREGAPQTPNTLQL